jgi:hypothetical protein
VPALQRAVPGADDHHGAVRVGQHLRLDVPRPVQVPLDEALAAAERRLRLAHRRGVQLRDLGQRPGHLQAAAAAAERGLDRHRQAVLGGERDHLVRAGDRVRGAGHQRRADPQRQVPGGHLVAEHPDRLDRRADPGQPGVQDGPGEVRVLGQEAVPRVHRVGAGRPGGGEDLVDAQVRVGRRAAAERERLVGEPDVPGVPVRLGVDRDAGQPGVPAGPGHPDGDLAPIGDQHGAHA